MYISTQTYTACTGVVQPIAWVAFAHGAQIGTDTVAVFTTAFV